MPHVISLDVGAARIGVAIASTDARIPRPLTTINHDDHVIDTISQMIAEHDAVAVVVGLPRGMDGQFTAQTAHCQAFAATLRAFLTIPVAEQDETLTSKAAEAELDAKGKPYRREAIDAMAATIILRDYLQEHVDLTKEAR